MGEGATARSRWTIPHVALQLVVAGLSIVRARDPDLGFHLATGRAVLALGRIPATNVLSFAEPDAVAINQQWLPAVLFELAYRRFGIAGPTCLKWLLVGITFAVVLDTARRLGAGPSGAMFVTVLAAVAASPRFVERPLLFSNLCIALVAWCIAWRLSQRARPHGAPFVVAALATVVAVHLHAGAVFAFALLGVTALATALTACRARSFQTDDGPSRPLREALLFVAALGGAFALSALTLALYHPHGLRVLTVPFSMASDPFLHTTLIEFRPPWAFPAALLAPYWVFVALAVLLGVASLGRVSIVVLATMAFGVVLSLRHVRFLDLASLLAAPSLAVALERAAPRFTTPRRFRLAAGALALLTGLAGFGSVVAAGQSGFGYEPSVWPIDLLRDLRRLRISGRAFVQDGWAGPYLAFRYPEERVFFHPAFDWYSPSFYRDTYLRVRDAEEGWSTILDRHHVEVIVLKYTSPNERKRQEGHPNLRQRLAVDPKWALVSFDDYGLAYVRRARLSDLSRREIIEALDPDRGVFLGAPSRALPGLIRLRERGMGSHRQATLAEIAARIARN